jgi:hypothetical protein
MVRPNTKKGWNKGMNRSIRIKMKRRETYQASTYKML